MDWFLYDIGLRHEWVNHFLNDENHTQIVSPGNKKLIRRMYENLNEWKQLLLYLYLRPLQGIKLELTFSLLENLNKISHKPF